MSGSSAGQESGNGPAPQFAEQGGASTMDPAPLRRWLTSRVMTRLCDQARRARLHQRAERARRRAGRGHIVEYFHQVDDPYSQLAAQLLAPILDRYDVTLIPHLVDGPGGRNAPEPALLAGLSRYDAARVAPGYGLAFSEPAGAPPAGRVALASAILAVQDDVGFVECAAAVGAALWRGDDLALESLAARHGSGDEALCAARIEAGRRRRSALGHYGGAMFYYGGEWYWGVDRLYHLERRLAALGADRQRGESLLAPRPPEAAGPTPGAADLTLEIYPSLRSPYTAIAFDRALRLARDSGVQPVVRPVLPMVMRGAPITRTKGFYIIADAAREARAAGVPFGRIYDPIGEPVRRAYSLYPWACEEGRGSDLLSAFLGCAFARGVNTNRARGLRRVVEAAGLSWGEAQRRLGAPGWEGPLEENRRRMYGAGLWGVPSFRLLDKGGQPLLSAWGQDRLWLIARTIRERASG